jgi:hypothetical protein
MLEVLNLKFESTINYTPDREGYIAIALSVFPSVCSSVPSFIRPLCCFCSITLVLFDLRYSNFIHRLLMEGGYLGLLLDLKGQRSRSLLL